jgi:hypothetical protein
VQREGLLACGSAHSVSQPATGAPAPAAPGACRRSPLHATSGGGSRPGPAAAALTPLAPCHMLTQRSSSTARGCMGGGAATVPSALAPRPTFLPALLLRLRLLRLLLLLAAALLLLATALQAGGQAPCRPLLDHARDHGVVVVLLDGAVGQPLPDLPACRAACHGAGAGQRAQVGVCWWRAGAGRRAGGTRGAAPGPTDDRAAGQPGPTTRPASPCTGAESPAAQAVRSASARPGAAARQASGPAHPRAKSPKPTRQDDVHGVRHVRVHPPLVPLQHLHRHVKGGRRRALQHALLHAAPPRLLVAQRDRLDAAHLRGEAYGGRRLETQEAQGLRGSGAQRPAPPAAQPL